MLKHHGDPVGIYKDAIFTDDFDLWMVGANLHEWSEYHDKACQCDGLCTCEN